MKRLHLKTDTARTEIIVDEGLLARAPEIIAKRFAGGRIVIVTDALLAKTHAKKIIADLAKLREVVTLRVPRGEAAKKLSVVERLCAQMLKARTGRDDALVAFGGGAIGDMAGFAAAVYMRGIPFAQIPTTLNAQADSGIGGKTGVNLPGGKNIVGAFHQPRIVLIDPCALATLSTRDFNAGMAEVIKTAVIGDARLFARIARETEAIKARNPKVLAGIIAACARFKAGVVGQDERESGRRMILNFGHTVGHAVETAAGHGRIRHGEAVAMGMVAAAKIAVLKKMCSATTLHKLSDLLAKFDLPVRIPAALQKRLPRLTARDKKTRGSTITLVLPRRIGEVGIVGGHTTKDIAKLLKDAGWD